MVLNVALAILEGAMLSPRSERASESLQEEVKKKFPKPNCVSFDEVVTVKSIPSYTDYSEEVRNRLEYQAENLNWREAVEEDQMNSCCCMGEKIHPVHFDVCYQANYWFRRFLRILSRKKRKTRSVKVQ